MTDPSDRRDFLKRSGALALSLGGWLRRAATPAERALAGVAGLLLLYPATGTDAAGLAVIGLTVGLHLARVRSR